METVKKYHLLLFGFGFSYLGNWIHLIALNLLIWKLTESPAAMAGIYIIGPLARTLTSFFAGSIIDRSNKQRLMVYVDLIRGALVLLIPFMSSIWLIYTLLFFINMASSFFAPSSTYYISKYVPADDKQQFNSLLGMFSSGSFLIGPALAGLIISISSINTAIWINALTFFICAWVIYKLPSVESQKRISNQPLTWNIIKSDYLVIYQFLRKETYFLSVFLSVQIALMIAFALDSQEATFIKQNLQASDQIYGIMISITGAGAIAGGFAATFFAKKFSTKQYMMHGLFFTVLFYSLFFASPNIILAMVMFIGLGVSMSFSSAGYSTFYQKNVPTDLMGRFGSISSIFTNILQMLFTLLLGVLADLFSLKIISLIFGSIAILIALNFYFIMSTKHSFKLFKRTTSS
ncbi:MFS transporter [Psychrobacillus psychrotolerans]|uniref:MFS transporter n=1 Tax=Psychrobacillus psychrotolerans TaxID=126156 RepID=UPI0033159482